MSKSQNPAYGTLGQAIRSRNSAPKAGIGAFTGNFGLPSGSALDLHQPDRARGEVADAAHNRGSGGSPGGCRWQNKKVPRMQGYSLIPIGWRTSYANASGRSTRPCNPRKPEAFHVAAAMQKTHSKTPSPPPRRSAASDITRDLPLSTSAESRFAHAELTRGAGIRRRLQRLNRYISSKRGSRRACPILTSDRPCGVPWRASRQCQSPRLPAAARRRIHPQSSQHPPQAWGASFRVS